MIIVFITLKILKDEFSSGEICMRLMQALMCGSLSNSGKGYGTSLLRQMIHISSI